MYSTRGSAYHDFGEVVIYAGISPEHVNRYSDLWGCYLMPPHRWYIQPET